MNATESRDPAGIFRAAADRLDELAGLTSDAPWIAALGPQVAAPLAAWLRETADVHDEIERIAGPDALPRTGIQTALTVARTILGETGAGVGS